MLGKLRNMTAIYLFRKGRVLLLFKQGGRVVSNVWTGSAGGHFENTELNDAKACVLRELTEELGLHENDLRHLSMRYVTLRRTNGEIRQNYYFFADLNEDVSENLVSTEGETRWFHLDEIGDLEMPFTAKYVINHYCTVGRWTDKMYTGITSSSGVTFVETPEC